LKRLLREALNLPRYGPVALDDPQRTVEVWLEGLGAPRDVTRNNVVAALRPFTVGIMLGEGAPPPREEQTPRLCFRDRTSQHLLGVLHLSPAGAIALPGYRFCLFEMKNCENYCVSRLQLRAYDLREQWRAERRQRRNPHNFRMSHADIRCSHVFYICPRPVVLVTVEHGGSGNMFPMDLIGPTDSPWFSMALRLTSPAVELMRQSRRMALASVPFSHKEVAYRLGEHHRKASIDWSSLPFPLEPSPQFHLPVAQAALRTREVQVEEFHTVGSHMLFLTSLVSETHREPPRENQLFHAFYGTRHSPEEQGRTS
jgi:flavin reductase (DIM6/NTAB) family NADH-FMN oxidoreductase RutF